MKWAFIDLENIGKLNDIDFSCYERAILFVGANQDSICFGKPEFCAPIDITYIRIKEVKKNNLDFHLSYYLGHFDQIAPKEVSFEVISNDLGFSPLVEHINSLNRECVQVRPSANVRQLFIEEYYERIATNIIVLPEILRPKKVDALRNYISTCINLEKGNKLVLQRYVNALIKGELLTINNKLVNYHC